MLREVDNEDEQWREKVMSLKAEITDAKKSENNIEYFSIKFKKGKDKEAIMMMGWENTIVEVPFNY